MNKLIKNKKGFTLVEVITALAIFAITAMMLVGAIYTALSISQKASDMNRGQLKTSAGLENSFGDPSATLPEGVTREPNTDFSISFKFVPGP